MALRAAILGHIRVPVQTLTLNGLKLQTWSLCNSNRSMSSHGDDHLDKQQVIDRVLAVVKSFPKVDPAKNPKEKRPEGESQKEDPVAAAAEIDEPLVILDSVTVCDEGGEEDSKSLIKRGGVIEDLIMVVREADFEKRMKRIEKRRRLNLAAMFVVVVGLILRNCC